MPFGASFLSCSDNMILQTNNGWAGYMRGRSWCGLLCCCLLVSGCTAAQALSLRLKPMMSEQQVIDTLGQPKSADLGTCGQATPKPWMCKTLHYGEFHPSLMIQLRMDQTGTWRVFSWDVF